MAWTYSGDPTASPKDEIRFLIGDTNPNDQQLQDAEINYCIISVYGSLANAPPHGNLLPAAFAADNLAGIFSRLADKSVGDLHISYSSRFKQFQEMAQRLRSRATNLLVPMYAGGESWAEKNANYANKDIIQPAAQISGMNYITGEPQRPEESERSTGP